MEKCNVCLGRNKSKKLTKVYMASDKVINVCEICLPDYDKNPKVKE